jgi:predicted lipid-binding transport protein (Tim44 family)
MNGETFDIYTLLFLVLAVVIFLRLRNVLARRTGNERQPYDPYAAPDAKSNGAGAAGQDKGVPLPRANNAEEKDEEIGVEERLEKFAPKGSPLSKGLLSIVKSDPSFDPEQFIEGAKSAYEMIVMAFAGGDKKSLGQLLGQDVYEGFVGAIEEREERGEKVDSSFVGIDKASIIEAECKRKSAQVTMKFVSELITATTDKKGKVIDGDPKKVREVTDIWTFARDITSRDPNWKLVATEAAN